MRPTAPGRLATHSATAIIQSMPPPISRHNGAVEAERHREQRQHAGRHHPGRDDRHRQQVGDHAVRREPVEMIGRVRRGREAGDQRGHDQRRRSRARPTARCARRARCRRRRSATAGRAGRRRSARASPQTTSGSSDAPPLPAPAAARRAPRPRACATSAPARSTITPTSTMRDHDEGALRRDLGAREQQIERRRDAAPRAPPIS